MSQGKIKNVFSLWLIIAWVVLSSIGDPESSFAQHSRRHSISVGGLERTYLLYIPASHDPSKPTPLVLLFHGGGGTGQGMEKLALGGFNRLADREGFIVVYPDGIEKHWNDGRGLQHYRAH